MKVIIAGSRTFTDYQRLCQVLAPDRHRIAQVITGGARGADQLGYRWAWKHAIRHQLFRAEWERFGKSAGVRRNYQMAHAGDVLVAFWDGQSPGTAHMVQCMGIPVKRDISYHQSLSAIADWRLRARGNSSIWANTVSKRSGNSRRKNREAGVDPSDARQSKLCRALHTW